MEVGLIDQVLKEVDCVPPEMADAVPLKRQEAEIYWQGSVVNLIELVVGDVQVFNVVEVGQVPICSDIFDLIS